MSVKGESHPKVIENNEESNIRDSEIWVNLFESGNDNPYELLQTVKYLKAELKRVKEDNEHILKEEDELNNVLLTKLHSNEEENNKGPELNMERTAPYKCKVKKLEFSTMRLNLQANNQLNIILKNIKILVKVLIVIRRKINTNRMNKFLVNSKGSNLLCSMEKLKKEKKQKLFYLE